MIQIDGSFGEGGGQILRTSLSLAAITGMELKMTHIRAKRPKPGLMRQHLMCAKAVAEICGGELLGAKLGSATLELRPGRIEGGEYRFAIGSAGSTMLLAQTVLPVLLYAKKPSHIILEGGTHAENAPIFDFFDRCYLPCLRKMGAEVEAHLLSYGFYPAGGGKIELSVKPIQAWSLFTLTERGALRDARVTAIGSGLDETILTDELRLFQTGLDGLIPFQFQEEHQSVRSCGPGNVLFATLDFENLTEMFSVCGSVGISRKIVANRAVGYVRSYIRRNWVVGMYLADQLMLPMALGAGGCYLTGKPTLHAETNRKVIQQLLDMDVQFKKMDDHIFMILCPKKY